MIFYSHIRTEGIRTFVIISLILNAFSYSKAQIPHRFCSKPLSMRCFHGNCSFPHNLEQRHSVFARGCVENYSAFTQNFSVFVCCLQIQGISTSPHQNTLNIKEAMNNFLTRPVRIQVRNKQNRSRDSPPWIKVIVQFVNIMPPLPNTANFSTKYFLLSKVYTDEGGIK